MPDARIERRRPRWSGRGDTNRGRDADDPGSPGGTPTGTPTRTGTPTGDGDPGGSDPATGVGCPSFVESADRTVCFSGRTAPEVYLEPSTTEFVEYSADDEVETVSFALHNDGDSPFLFNPHDWAVKRRTESGWTHVAPDAYVEPLYEVLPGETYEWVLSTEPHSAPMAENARSVVVDLDSGETYAFRVHGLVDDSERVECVARFEYVRAVPAR